MVMILSATRKTLLSPRFPNLKSTSFPLQSQITSYKSLIFLHACSVMKTSAFAGSLRAILILCCVSLGSPAFAYHIYVTNEKSGDVSVIDGATREVLATIPVGKRPRGIRVSPDATTLFVAV